MAVKLGANMLRLPALVQSLGNLVGMAEVCVGVPPSSGKTGGSCTAQYGHGCNNGGGQGVALVHGGAWLLHLPWFDTALVEKRFNV